MNQEEILSRIKNDFPWTAANNLRIWSKSGELIPFTLNRAQLYLYKRAQQQLKAKGKIRLVVLKGRQQGLSTFIGGYLYHRTIYSKGMLTFIFAHDSDGSNSLYNMVRTFYDQTVSTDIRPPLSASNAKELLFNEIGSGYRVGTAGTTGLGRSKTIQQLHWSEVAYSPHCEEHARGVLQAVPDMAGTAVFLESTSNGEGDYFHRMCQAAQSGNSDYELCFIPWYWQDDYKRTIDADFKLDNTKNDSEHVSEADYMDLFAKDGLTLEHMAWRRQKILTDFHGDVVRFMREYPFTPEEAFQSNSNDAFIKPMMVRRARNNPAITTSAPLIFGVDPAREGGDAFKVCHRKGRNMTKLHTLPAGRIDETAQRLIHEINKYKPMRVNIDCGGLGVGVYDILVGSGYGPIVRKVDFGGSAINKDENRNKRAEMYRAARDWLENLPCSISCEDAEAAKLQAELAVCKVKWHNNAQLAIIPKEEIKKELGFSPDNADAFVLTFADPVANPETNKFARPMETVVASTTWSPFD